MRIVEKQTITNDMFFKPNMELVGNLNKQNNERMDSFVGNDALQRSKDDVGVIYEKSNPLNYSKAIYTKPVAASVNANTIKDVQNKLNGIGYSCGVPNGIMGDSTKLAVASFQKLCGLKKQNGEITDETITTLNVVYKRALNGGLSRGLRNNSDVKKLQENLNRLNYNCGNPDGTFGLSTEVAVKKFQVDHGLTKDGVVGKTTLNAIVDSGPKTISEKGFKLLSDIEVPAGAKKDKNGKIISIPIVDVGDDKYTVGMGNAVDKNDTKTIAEYKRKYGVDVTKVGAQVDYDTCLRIFNDHIEEFTGTLDRMLKRNGYVPTQNEYDAMVIAVYNRPALANPGNALDTLIKNNSHNREEWRTTILNEYKGLDLWNSKGRGWTNRINEEIELFFDGDYTKNY